MRHAGFSGTSASQSFYYICVVRFVLRTNLIQVRSRRPLWASLLNARYIINLKKHYENKNLLFNLNVWNYSKY